MAGAPDWDPARLATAAMVRAQEKVYQAQGAAAALVPAAARAEAAQATNLGPAREKRPVDYSPKVKLYSSPATAREFPRRCERALAKESSLEGSARITKS